MLLQIVVELIFAVLKSSVNGRINSCELELLLKVNAPPLHLMLSRSENCWWYSISTDTFSPLEVDTLPPHESHPKLWRIYSSYIVNTPPWGVTNCVRSRILPRASMRITMSGWWRSKSTPRLYSMLAMNPYKFWTMRRNLDAEISWWNWVNGTASWIRLRGDGNMGLVEWS